MPEIFPAIGDWVEVEITIGVKATTDADDGKIRAIGEILSRDGKGATVGDRLKIVVKSDPPLTGMIDPQDYMWSTERNLWIAKPRAYNAKAAAK